MSVTELLSVDSGFEGDLDLISASEEELDANFRETSHNLDTNRSVSDILEN